MGKNGQRGWSRQKGMFLCSNSSTAPTLWLAVKFKMEKGEFIIENKKMAELKLMFRDTLEDTKTARNIRESKGWLK